MNAYRYQVDAKAFVPSDLDDTSNQPLSSTKIRRNEKNKHKKITCSAKQSFESLQELVTTRLFTYLSLSSKFQQ